MDDLDRLRSRDDARAPVEDPVHDGKPDNRLAWIGLLVMLAVVGGGLWFWGPRSRQSPSEAVGRVPIDEVVERSAPEMRGLGVGEPAADLPPLGEMDGYVRPLLSTLSGRPELAALLATDGLVRRFVVSVEAVARGASPASQVAAVAPRGAFQVRFEGGDQVVDPASYARYDGLVSMVEDLDPQRLAALYGQLKPRFEEAYAELGVEGTFDQAMTRAIRHLLETPAAPPTPGVRPARGTNFAYTDPRLESLSHAQRQLLRLGPDRAARVEARLRAFGLALGLRGDQLPSGT